MQRSSDALRGSAFLFGSLAVARLARHDIRCVVAVSHGYHLPRVELAFDEAGRAAFTVNAEETRTLVQLSFYMAREVLAFWAYYVAPAIASRRA